MAKDVRDCEKFMEIMTEDTGIDRYVPTMPWKKVELPKKVGFLKPLKFVPLSKPAERAY